MKILALDLATATGWAYGERTGPPRYGTFTLPGLSDASREESMASIYSAVQTLVRENQVEAVVIEAPLSGNITKLNKRGIRTQTSSHGVQVLTMLSGAAQAGAFSGGARRFWMPQPHEWRKSVYGAGFPEDPKQRAKDYCRQVYQLVIESGDAAEAAAMLSFGHGQAKLL